MLRLTTLFVCVLAISASPFEKALSKKVPYKNLNPRIINGEPARLGQFPWQAAVYVNGDGVAWFCGGTIIDEEWVLTAGHCVDGGISARVLVGSVELNFGGPNEITSQHLILHEGYDRNTLANDIGLVHLSKPIQFNDNISPIPLSRDVLNGGEDVTVSGWGLTSDDGDSVSPVLNFVGVRTISNDECEETYGKGSIDKGIVCASFEGTTVKSPCSGDSGGPVVLGQGEQARHVAVVSFVSDAGCESGAPSGYTRTASFVDWIEQHTNTK